MHTINEIYCHFSLQLGNTMIKVVPITYDINASEVAHTEDESIQTGMIIHWHVQIAHTAAEYINSAAT